MDYYVERDGSIIFYRPLLVKGRSTTPTTVAVKTKFVLFAIPTFHHVFMIRVLLEKIPLFVTDVTINKSMK